RPEPSTARMVKGADSASPTLPCGASPETVSSWATLWSGGAVLSLQATRSRARAPSAAVIVVGANRDNAHLFEVVGPVGPGSARSPRSARWPEAPPTGRPVQGTADTVG